MKKVFALVASMIVACQSGFAVGAVSLNNYDSQKPIFYLTSGTLASGNDCYVQILAPLPGGTYMSVANTMGQSVFPIVDGYFDGGFGDVPGVPDYGNPVTFMLRAWKGSENYASANFMCTVTWTQRVGADPGAPTIPTPAILNIPYRPLIGHLETVNPDIPEPSSVALGIVGAAALFFYRSKPEHRGWK